MPGRRDLIAVVESCYDLGASQDAWLQGVADTVCNVVRPEVGLLAYHIDVDEQGDYALTNPVQSGDPPLDMVRRNQVIADLLRAKRREKLGLFRRAQATFADRAVRAALREPAEHILQSEFHRVAPNWVYTLGAPVDDLFVLMNHHIDDNGATAIFAGLKGKRTYRSMERQMFQMLSAHIKAGLRLRRRLQERTGGVDAPEDGAVLDASGRLVHAEGEARDGAGELTENARRIDHARSAKSGRQEDALSVWQGLIQGRWSLVEQWDTDGKRFMLAHKNPEDVRDPRGLTAMETRVVGLAVRGYADKLIAYHLGLAEGTVSSHLGSALRKLGIASRIDLVRQLGTRYPQTDL